MRCGTETRRWFWPRGLLRPSSLLAFLIAAGASAGCGSPTTSPDGATPRYVGQWSGTIASEAIGQGTLTVTFQTQTDTPSSSVVSGVAIRTFAEGRFSGTVLVTGSTLPGGGLGLTFDRASVPCPAEAGGESLRTLIATLAVAGDMMQGTYVAGGCPGGTLLLKKQ